MPDTPMPSRGGMPAQTSPPARIGARVALLVGLGALVACDSTATITPNSLPFRELQIVSAYPAVEQSGVWVRACQSPDPEGLMLNVAFVSSPRSADTLAAQDRDNSIRPLDVIDMRVVDGGEPDDIFLATGSDNVLVGLDCIDPVPDGSLSTCNGPVNPVWPDTELEYMALAANRTIRHNVLMLIDQSGSTIGLVHSGGCTAPQECGSDDDDAAAGCSCVENSSASLQGKTKTPFKPYASDFSNLRQTAAQTFLTLLNDRDRFAALAFGEGLGGSFMKVPCSKAVGNVDDDLNSCFGINRDLWTDSDGISSLGGGNTGRSNLWTAVKRAYTFLKSKADMKGTNHIVVVTDGPDSCAASDAFGACQTVCSDTDHHEVIQLVEAANLDPNGLKIHIHFVQFESLGYRGRDPRQVEVACESEGHFQFINSESMSKQNKQAFQEALETAMRNVRLTLMGSWQLRSSVPVYEMSGGAGVKLGSLHALSGTVTLTAGTKMVVVDQPFPFGVGQGELADAATTWDRRPTVRKPCAQTQDCDGAPIESAVACHIVCSDDTGICPAGSAGVQVAHGAGCDTDLGAHGACCEGTCQQGQCTACE